MTTPLLLVVTGPPCSGKSSITRLLSKNLRLLLLEKDWFKEILFDEIGTDQPTASLFSQTSFAIMFGIAEKMLQTGQSVVIEGNFSSPQAKIITSWQDHHDFRLAQIFCTADWETLWHRHQRRARYQDRHAGHRDKGDCEQFNAWTIEPNHEPLPIPGKLIEVNTSERVDIKEITRQVMNTN